MKKREEKNWNGKKEKKNLKKGRKIGKGKKKRRKNDGSNSHISFYCIPKGRCVI